MRNIGNAMSNIGHGDAWISGDEFKFTSAKIEEHIAVKTAPEGLERVQWGSGHGGISEGT